MNELKNFDPINARFLPHPLPLLVNASCVAPHLPLHVHIISNVNNYTYRCFLIPCFKKAHVI